MRPAAHLRLPDGTLAVLEHGDLVGRLWSAALRVDDPRVSEAHAMVSLRGGELWLLALRRMVAVDGKPVSEVALAPGVAIELAPGLVVQVETVELPAEILAVRAPGMPTLALPSVCSVFGGAKPSLASGFRPDAPASIWSDGVEWRLRVGDVERPVHPGARFDVDGATFEIVTLPVGSSGPGATRVLGGVHAPLRIVANWDQVHLHRPDEPTLVIGGVGARLISELVQLGGPASWDVVAREIWKDDSDDDTLRNRWDVVLARLRNRLREARIRPDLIQTDGRGGVALVLRDGDTVEDRS
jgi:hypothetical protein